MRFSPWLLTLPLLSLPTSLAHMEMATPVPWDSPTSADVADRDYDIKSPLAPDGSNFPCQGISNDISALPITATYLAGQTYNATIEGSANHNGGSCQLSLSYDDGKTFKVLKSMIGGCPLAGETSYSFTIPVSAPTGTALFAWTWINHSGNREFYMNCAVVHIDGISSGGDLCALPNLYVANLPGINGCVSPEGSDPVYPHPGTDVEYANGYSNSSVPGPDSCEIAAPACSSVAASVIQSSTQTPGSTITPYTEGPKTVASGTGTGPITGPGFAVTSATFSGDTGSSANPATVYVTATSTSAYEVTVVPTGGLPTQLPGSPYLNISSPYYNATISSYSRSCSRSTVTLFSTASLPAATCTAPVVQCNCAPGDSCTPINACTTLCGQSLSLSTLATVTRSNSGGGSLVPTTTATAAHPPYVTGDPNTASYLPCTPGNFLCASPTLFWTCIQATAGIWTWGAQRGTADGMMCLPFGNSTIRDDRYVRAQPFGDCSTDGTLACNATGLGFWACDQGGWIDMGAVAEGTVCRNGQIVAA